jgi:hypothetical protein
LAFVLFRIHRVLSLFCFHRVLFLSLSSRVRQIGGGSLRPLVGRLDPRTDYAFLSDLLQVGTRPPKSAVPDVNDHRRHKKHKMVLWTVAFLVLHLAVSRIIVMRPVAFDEALPASSNQCTLQ